MKLKSIAVYLLLSCAACSTPAYKKDPQVARMVVEESANFTPPERLINAELDDDIHFLIHALDRAYIGKEALDKKVCDHLIATLEAIPKSKSMGQGAIPLSLCYLLNEYLFAVPDGHLEAFHRDFQCGARREYRTPVGTNLFKGDKVEWGFRTLESAGKKILVLGGTSFPYPQKHDWSSYPIGDSCLWTSPPPVRRVKPGFKKHLRLQ